MLTYWIGPRSKPACFIVSNQPTREADLSAAVQHSGESSDTHSQVFHFDFGDVKLLKGPKYRLYYCYTPQGGFMYMRQTGRADNEKILHHTLQISKDESWPNGAKVFFDLRWYDSSAYNFDIYFKMVLKIAEIYEKNARHYGKVVSLCGSDSEYGLHRMFQSILDDGKRVLGAVRDFEEAVEFLNIDREILDRIIAEVDKIEASESKQA